MNKIGIFLVVVMALLSVSLAASPLTRVSAAMQELCGGLKALLPVAAMLMVVIAGVIYAAGQVMGAETRARANVWATAALTGALIAVLIYAVAPVVLNTIYGGSGTTEIAGTNTNVCD
jgi:hypothetical protein